MGALLTSSRSGLDSQSVAFLLKRTADDLDQRNPDYAGHLGAGRVNALRAALCAWEGMPVSSPLP